MVSARLRSSAFIQMAHHGGAGGGQPIVWATADGAATSALANSSFIRTGATR